MEGQTAGGGFIEIGGRRFSTWRGSRVRDPDFRLTLRTGLNFAIAALVFYCLVVVWSLIWKPDNQLISFVLVVGAQSVIVNPLLIDAIGSWRKARREGRKVPDEARVGDPSGGVFVEVAVGDLGSFGWTGGVLDIDRGRLRFRGEAFGFVLRREDFLQPSRAAKRLRLGRDVGLAVPEGLSLPISLSAQRSRRADLQNLLEAWDGGDADAGETLFPPVDYRAPVPTLTDCAMDALSYVPLAVAVGAGFALFVLLSPPNLLPGHLTWGNAACAGFALSMAQTLSIFIVTVGRRKRHRLVQEQLSSERA